MATSLDKVIEVRNGLTDVVDKLISVFSTDDVITEVMTLRKYIYSPYAEEMRKTLKEVGIFKIDYFSEIQIVVPDLTLEDAKLYGLVDRNGNYLLAGIAITFPKRESISVFIKDISKPILPKTGKPKDLKDKVSKIPSTRYTRPVLSNTSPVSSSLYLG